MKFVTSVAGGELGIFGSATEAPHLEKKMDVPGLIRAHAASVDNEKSRKLVRDRQRQQQGTRWGRGRCCRVAQTYGFITMVGVATHIPLENDDGIL